MDWKILAKKHIFIDVNSLKKKKNVWGGKKKKVVAEVLVLLKWQLSSLLKDMVLNYFPLINQLALVRTSAQALARAWFRMGQSVPSPSSFWCFRKPHGRAQTTATEARNIPRPKRSTRKTVLTSNGNSRGPGLKQSLIISSVQPASVLPVQGKNKGNGLKNEL